MKEMRAIMELLTLNGFLFDEKEEIWTRDEWSVRIIDDDMEIYENDGRYLCTSLDYDTLVDILEQI